MIQCYDEPPLKPRVHNRNKLTGTFVQRDYDGNWQISADTSDPEFTGVESWFTKVYEAATDNEEG